MDTITKIAKTTIKEWKLSDASYIFEEVFDQKNPNNRLCFTEEECYKLIESPKELWLVIQYHGKYESTIMDLLNKTWEKIGRNLLNVVVE